MKTNQRVLVGLRGRRPIRAFTLIELMVVILILAILAALIVPRVVGRQDQAKVAKAQSDVAVLMDNLQAFRLDTDRYPTTEEGLQALRQPPADVRNWQGPYLQKAIPNDPWGNPYEYQYPGVTGDMPTVLSYGADGVPGGDGYNEDITSDGVE
ncbi:MAG TPA: type II secretion system major pseudopilin GspG [Fimbriimonas sp.]